MDKTGVEDLLWTFSLQLDVHIVTVQAIADFSKLARSVALQDEISNRGR